MLFFLDLAKAFDKVPHQRLLEKLKKRGIRGKLFSVTGDWLSNRKQRVCIKGRWSSWSSLWSGVPQGSVLGPLLFLIFINNLDEDINSHMKFADDTKIFKEVRNSADCSQLQADLDKLVLWAQTWQMEFNVDKCKVTHVGNRDHGSTYYMEGSELTKVSCEKRSRSLDIR